MLTIAGLVIPLIHCPLPFLIMACICHAVLKKKTSVFDKPVAVPSQQQSETRLAVPTGFLVSALITLIVGGYFTIDAWHGKYSALGHSMAIGVLPIILCVPLLLGFAIGVISGLMMELVKKRRKKGIQQAA